MVTIKLIFVFNQVLTFGNPIANTSTLPDRVKMMIATGIQAFPDPSADPFESERELEVELDEAAVVQNTAGKIVPGSVFEHPGTVLSVGVDTRVVVRLSRAPVQGPDIGRTSIQPLPPLHLHIH